MTLYKNNRAYRVPKNLNIATGRPDYLKMDFDIAVIKVLSTTASMFFSRLDSSSDGGKQSVLVIRSGAVFIKRRHLTNPSSYFGVADYAGQSVIAKGTQFYVEVANGQITTLVETSKVVADNGKGVTMPLLGGQGAVINSNGIRQFPVSYGLEVLQGRTQIFSDGRTNVFSGVIQPWQKIEVDGRLIDPDAQGDFKIRTRSNSYQVVHPFGLKKHVYPKGAAQPFFGH